jgi:carbon monoxide dehydrogenase subunit G
VSAVHASIDIAAPPEKVWEIVMNPQRLGDWVSIHRGLGKVSDSPLECGSELEQKLCLRGVTFKVKWKVAQLTSGTCTEWEGKGPARSTARTKYVLSADGNGGTRFDYENEFKAPMGPLGAVASKALVGGLPEREAEKSLAALKQLAES